MVQVDAANDLALLKADGKFSPLPIVASRSAHLGGAGFSLLISCRERTQGTQRRFFAVFVFFCG
jgi:hypothetical protein